MTKKTPTYLSADKPIPKGSGHILVVDDNRALLQTTETMLKQLGYSVSTINNTAEAVKRLKENSNKFDLFVIDQTMPHMQGIDLVDIIKPLKPDAPIIMTSGFDRKVNATNFKKFGIVNYITKPFTMRVLGLAVQEALAVKAVS